MLSNEFLRRDAVLDVVREVQADKARVLAREVRALEELDGSYGSDRSLLLELAGTARVGQVKACGQVERACRLVRNLPVALSLLEAGVMFVGTADLLLALTRNASEAVLRELDRRLSVRVAAMDAADARALIAQTLVEVEAELDREEQERRYAQARENRGVWVKPVEDGMARIGAEVDAVAAKEFVLWMEELERAERLADEQTGAVRTKAQRMADILLELPARYAALVNALRSGKLDALLAQAGIGPASSRTTTSGTAEAADLSDRTNESASDETDAAARAPVPLELDLDLPPAGPPRPWELELRSCSRACWRCRSSGRGC